MAESFKESIQDAVTSIKNIENSVESIRSSSNGQVNTTAGQTDTSVKNKNHAAEAREDERKQRENIEEARNGTAGQRQIGKGFEAVRKLIEEVLTKDASERDQNEKDALIEKVIDKLDAIYNNQLVERQREVTQKTISAILKQISAEGVAGTSAIVTAMQQGFSDISEALKGMQSLLQRETPSVKIQPPVSPAQVQSSTIERIFEKTIVEDRQASVKEAKHDVNVEVNPEVVVNPTPSPEAKVTVEIPNLDQFSNILQLLEATVRKLESVQSESSSSLEIPEKPLQNIVVSPLVTIANPTSSQQSSDGDKKQIIIQTPERKTVESKIIVPGESRKETTQRPSSLQFNVAVPSDFFNGIKQLANGFSVNLRNLSLQPRRNEQDTWQNLGSPNFFNAKGDNIKSESQQIVQRNIPVSRSVEPMKVEIVNSGQMSTDVVKHLVPALAQKDRNTELRDLRTPENVAMRSKQGRTTQFLIKYLDRKIPMLGSLVKGYLGSMDGTLSGAFGAALGTYLPKILPVAIGIAKWTGAIGSVALAGYEIVNAFQDAEKNREKGEYSAANRKVLATTLTTAIGGGLGFFLGGPAGAMFGAGIASMLGRWFGDKWASSRENLPDNSMQKPIGEIRTKEAVNKTVDADMRNIFIAFPDLGKIDGGELLKRIQAGKLEGNDIDTIRKSIQERILSLHYKANNQSLGENDRRQAQIDLTSALQMVQRLKVAGESRSDFMSEELNNMYSSFSGMATGIQRFLTDFHPNIDYSRSEYQIPKDATNENFEARINKLREIEKQRIDQINAAAGKSVMATFLKEAYDDSNAARSKLTDRPDEAAQPYRGSSGKLTYGNDVTYTNVQSQNFPIIGAIHRLLKDQKDKGGISINKEDISSAAVKLSEKIEQGLMARKDLLTPEGQIDWTKMDKIGEFVLKSFEDQIGYLHTYNTTELPKLSNWNPFNWLRDSTLDSISIIDRSKFAEINRANGSETPKATEKPSVNKPNDTNATIPPKSGSTNATPPQQPPVASIPTNQESELEAVIRESREFNPNDIRSYGKSAALPGFISAKDMMETTVPGKVATPSTEPPKQSPTAPIPTSSASEIADVLREAANWKVENAVSYGLAAAGPGSGLTVADMSGKVFGEALEQNTKAIKDLTQATTYLKDNGIQLDVNAFVSFRDKMHSEGVTDPAEIFRKFLAETTPTVYFSDKGLMERTIADSQAQRITNLNNSDVETMDRDKNGLPDYSKLYESQFKKAQKYFEMSAEEFNRVISSIQQGSVTNPYYLLSMIRQSLQVAQDQNGNYVGKETGNDARMVILNQRSVGERYAELIHLRSVQKRNGREDPTIAVFRDQYATVLDKVNAVFNDAFTLLSDRTYEENRKRAKNSTPLEVRKEGNQIRYNFRVNGENNSVIDTTNIPAPINVPPKSNQPPKVVTPKNQGENTDYSQIFATQYQAAKDYYDMSVNDFNRIVALISDGKKQDLDLNKLTLLIMASPQIVKNEYGQYVGHASGKDARDIVLNIHSANESLARAPLGENDPDWRAANEILLSNEELGNKIDAVFNRAFKFIEDGISRNAELFSRFEDFNTKEESGRTSYQFKAGDKNVTGSFGGNNAPIEVEVASPDTTASPKPSAAPTETEKPETPPPPEIIRSKSLVLPPKKRKPIEPKPVEIEIPAGMTMTEAMSRRRGEEIRREHERTREGRNQQPRRSTRRERTITTMPPKSEKPDRRNIPTKREEVHTNETTINVTQVKPVVAPVINQPIEISGLLTDGDYQRLTNIIGTNTNALIDAINTAFGDRHYSKLDEVISGAVNSLRSNLSSLFGRNTFNIESPNIDLPDVYMVHDEPLLNYIKSEMVNLKKFANDITSILTGEGFKAGEGGGGGSAGGGGYTGGGYSGGGYTRGTLAGSAQPQPPAYQGSGNAPVTGMTPQEAGNLLNGFTEHRIGGQVFLAPQNWDQNSYHRRGQNREAESWLANRVVDVEGAQLSSRAGWRKKPTPRSSEFHRGVDVVGGKKGAIHGANLKAFMGGTVLGANTQRGYGQIVTIKGDDGNIYRYAHMKDFNVRAGQRVEAGQSIGHAGNTGVGTGSHLHFEIRDSSDRRVIDPVEYAKVLMQRQQNQPASQPTNTGQPANVGQPIQSGAQPTQPRGTPAAPPGGIVRRAPTKRMQSLIDRQGDYIAQVAQKYNIPTNVLLGQIQQESGGNANARSRVGAVGLMQLMPRTAGELGVTDRTNERQSIEGGAKYMSQLLRRYKGNMEHALMAYNWGMGNVDKLLSGKKSWNQVPAEARNYAQGVLSKAQAYEVVPGTTPSQPQPQPAPTQPIPTPPPAPIPPETPVQPQVIPQETNVPAVPNVPSIPPSDSSVQPASESVSERRARIRAEIFERTRQLRRNAIIPQSPIPQSQPTHTQPTPTPLQAETPPVITEVPVRPTKQEEAASQPPVKPASAAPQTEAIMQVSPASEVPQVNPSEKAQVPPTKTAPETPAAPETPVKQAQPAEPTLQVPTPPQVKPAETTELTKPAQQTETPPTVTEQPVKPASAAPQTEAVMPPKTNQPTEKSSQVAPTPATPSVQPSEKAQVPPTKTAPETPIVKPTEVVTPAKPAPATPRIQPTEVVAPVKPVTPTQPTVKGDIITNSNIYKSMYDASLRYAQMTGGTSPYSGDSFEAQEMRVRAGIQDRNTAIENMTREELYTALGIPITERDRKKPPLKPVTAPSPETPSVPTENTPQNPWKAAANLPTIGSELLGTPVVQPMNLPTIGSELLRTTTIPTPSILTSTPGTPPIVPQQPTVPSILTEPSAATLLSTPQTQPMLATSMSPTVPTVQPATPPNVQAQPVIQPSTMPTNPPSTPLTREERLAARRAEMERRRAERIARLASSQRSRNGELTTSPVTPITPTPVTTMPPSIVPSQPPVPVTSGTHPATLVKPVQPPETPTVEDTTGRGARRSPRDRRRGRELSPEELERQQRLQGAKNVRTALREANKLNRVLGNNKDVKGALDLAGVALGMYTDTLKPEDQQPQNGAESLGQLSRYAGQVNKVLGNNKDAARTINAVGVGAEILGDITNPERQPKTVGGVLKTVSKRGLQMNKALQGNKTANGIFKAIGALGGIFSAFEPEQPREARGRGRSGEGGRVSSSRRGRDDGFTGSLRQAAKAGAQLNRALGGKRDNGIGKALGILDPLTKIYDALAPKPTESQQKPPTQPGVSGVQPPQKPEEAIVTPPATTTPTPVVEDVARTEAAKVEATTKGAIRAQEEGAQKIAEAVKPEDKGTPNAPTGSKAESAGPAGDEETRAVTEYVLRYVFGENVNGSSVLSIF